MSIHIATASRTAELPLAPVEQSRADFYALIASLLLAPPDHGLLELLGEARTVSSPDASPFERAWLGLVGAARHADPAAVATEHARLFAAAGRPSVHPCASRYVGRQRSEPPLASLRGELHDLGLARRTGSDETEDHLGALCEVMRLMISGAPGVARQSLARQRRFFETRLAHWAPACVDDIRHAEGASFYARLADFIDAFFAVESHAFAIDDAPPAWLPPGPASAATAARPVA